MKRNRNRLFLSASGLVIMLVLMAGCYRPAAPDVTGTPAGGGEVVSPEEEQVATAIVEATRAAAAAGESEPAPTETLIPLSPEPTAVPQPTSEPPAATAVPEPSPTTSEAAPTSPSPTLPPPTSLPPTSPPSASGTTGTVTHVVQRGENLFRIALRYGTTVQAIASANGIANPASVYAGQRLIVPTSGGAGSAPQPATGTTYVVQPGDNLFRIALKYDMSYLHLAQYNGIANSSRVYVGQVLRIPPH